MPAANGVGLSFIGAEQVLNYDKKWQRCVELEFFYYLCISKSAMLGKRSRNGRCRACRQTDGGRPL